MTFFLAIFISLNKYLLGEFITFSRIILGSILFGLGLLFFNQILKFFEKITNKYFFKTLYTSKQAIEGLTKETTTIIDLDKLTFAIVDTIMKSMGLNRTGILLVDPGKENEDGIDKIHFFKTAKVVGFNEKNGISLVQDNFLTDWLEKNKKPLVFEELDLMARDAKNTADKEHFRNLQDNMRKIEAGLCLPLSYQNKLFGLIVLGNKISNEAYTKEDLELLETLANQASVGIQNARMYNNIQKIVDSQTKEIKEKNVYLEQLLQMKSEFLTIASHQLRTPITGVRGYLSMAKDSGASPQDIKDYINEAMEGANRMGSIIRDILTATELEGTKLTIALMPTDLKQIILDVLEQSKVLTLKKDLKLEFEEKDEIPKILSDARSLKEALLNLVSNAIYYTEKGSVKVILEKSNSYARITVRDTGRGFTSEEAKLFGEKFYRAPGIISIHPNGSGLGLFIVKMFVKAMNGRFEFKSDGLDKGSEFSLLIPLKYQ